MLKNRIIIVRHHEGDLDDTASTHLASLNYRIEHWYPFQTPDSVTLPDMTGVGGTIVMGGAQNVTELEELPYLQSEVDWILQCIAADLPVVGICLGSQLLAHALGGSVAVHPDGICEFGYEAVHPVESAENTWLTESMFLMQAHFQGFTTPPGCMQLATGDNFPNQAFLYKHNVFGFQFHPEVHSDMFKEWQQSDWKALFNATPGSRSPESQLPDNERYNQQQTTWFRNFLNRVFPPLTPS